MATNKATKNIPKQEELCPNVMSLSRDLMDAFGPVVGLAKICHSCQPVFASLVARGVQSNIVRWRDKVLRSDRLHIHTEVAVARIPSSANGEISDQSMKIGCW